MAVNKNAMLRYDIIDKCLNNKSEHYTFERLWDAVNDGLTDKGINGITKRQLRSDLKFMRDEKGFKAPIEVYQKDGAKYYRYSQDFSIHNNALAAEDRENLIIVIELLSRFKGVANNKWVEDIISNLEFRFNLKGDNSDLISFGNNDQLKGLNYLSKMIDAAIRKQPLKIEYATFKGDHYKFTFHTYYIKQYNNRWFAIGLSRIDSDKSIRTIALDRIVSLRKYNTSFIKNDEIDFATYFDDIIGVTKTDNSVETIKLRFDETRFPYVVTKPIHKSQKVVDEENCIISLRLIPNKEFYSKILEFGAQVEVLEPDFIRENIRKEYEKCLSQYSGNKES